MDKLHSTSTSNYVTAPKQNGRSRFGNWLSGFVDEVSRKSSDTLRKWIPSSSTTSIDACLITEQNAIHVNNPLGCSQKESKLIEFLEKKYIKIKTDVESIHYNIDLDENIDCSSISQLSNLRKNKINESYQFVNQTDERYIQIKQTNMESFDNNKTAATESIKPGFLHHSPIDTRNKETSITEDELPNFESFERTMKLGLIGRASTVQDMQTLKTLNILFTKKCKNIFVPISRSYSEQQDDEIISEYNNIYILNKRSRSLTDVQQNDINNKPNSNKRNKVTNSLPNILDKFETHNSLQKTDGDLLPCKTHKYITLRGNSYQSDSSHCSSVDSLLDSRKPDPEAILINLGFGPIESEDILSKIPKRFLQPSQVKGIDTEAFLRRQQLANNIHDHTVLGYRGLVGNPDIPPSTIVAKIMARFELNERNRSVSDSNMNRPKSAPPNSLDSFKT